MLDYYRTKDTTSRLYVFKLHVLIKKCYSCLAVTGSGVNNENTQYFREFKKKLRHVQKNMSRLCLH